MGEYVDRLVAASAVSHVKSYFRKSKTGKTVKVDAYTRKEDDIDLDHFRSLSRAEQAKFAEDVYRRAQTNPTLKASAKAARDLGFQNRYSDASRTLFRELHPDLAKSHDELVAQQQREGTHSAQPKKSSPQTTQKTFEETRKAIAAVVAERKAKRKLDPDFETKEALYGIEKERPPWPSDIQQRTSFRGDNEPNARELEALRHYVRNGAWGVNKSLRSGREGFYDDEEEATFKHMENILSRAQLNTDVVAYRGLYDAEDLGEIKPGTVLSDKGFGSFTEVPEWAEDFIDAKPPLKTFRRKNNKGALIEVKFPKGARVLDRNGTQDKDPLETKWGMNPEYEFIAARGYSLKVKSVKTRADGVLHIVTEYVQEATK